MDCRYEAARDWRGPGLSEDEGWRMENDICLTTSLTCFLSPWLIITHIFAEIAGFHLGCNKLIMNGLKTCASRTPNSAVARL